MAEERYLVEFFSAIHLPLTTLQITPNGMQDFNVVRAGLVSIGFQQDRKDLRLAMSRDSAPLHVELEWMYMLSLEFLVRPRYSGTNSLSVSSVKAFLTKHRSLPSVECHL
jgi:hypothetical protein